MSDLNAIRARHVERRGQSYGAPSNNCQWDGDPWRCDTAIVLAALDEDETTIEAAAMRTLKLERALDAALARVAALEKVAEYARHLTSDGATMTDYDLLLAALAETPAALDA